MWRVRAKSSGNLRDYQKSCAPRFSPPGSRGVPLMGRVFGRAEAYTYLPESTQRFLGREELAESMRRAGFAEVGLRDLFLGNLCVHWGTKA